MMSALSQEVFHFGDEPERQRAAALVKTEDGGAVEIVAAAVLDAGAGADVDEPAAVVDAGGDAAPGAQQQICVSAVQPAAAQAARQGVADHAGNAHFQVGAGRVDQLMPHSAAMLVGGQRLQMAQMDAPAGPPAAGGRRACR